LFTLIVQDCTEIVKLYSPQTEGNKDCEAHRGVKFIQTWHQEFLGKAS